MAHRLRRWTPPEILMVEGLRTSESDIYSFGMMMFELLTGQKPFYDFGQVVVANIVAANKLPSVPKTGVSPLLQTFRPLISECWDRVPSQRPTASALIEKLVNIAISIAAATSGNGPTPRGKPVSDACRWLVVLGTYA